MKFISFNKKKNYNFSNSSIKMLIIGDIDQSENMGVFETIDNLSASTLSK